jgi:hypothetical protein
MWFKYLYGFRIQLLNGMQRHNALYDSTLEQEKLKVIDSS